MTEHPSPQHPGTYVRENIIPKGMNVTAAAKKLDVSRVTLSNFLNGKSDLSQEMAARLEVAFGEPARKLLDLQSAWDAAQPRRADLTPKISSYVPPFLQIEASKIEAWGGSGIMPRQRLAVFLRTLVNSTGSGLTKVDFPGNDDSERPGWDGEVEAEGATPWVPQGRSGWEFGVNQNPKSKADGDFAKSVKGVDATKRNEMTFIFVTPRRWAGKDEWVKARKKEKQWKDVRAYDASDLEQWLEQSIPGQTWFANETEQDAHGAIALDEVWKIWAADCEPQLKHSLFDDALTAYRSTLKRAVTSNQCKPIIISADSRDEALAFLSAGFAADDPDLGSFRDRVIVFRETGTLSKLAAQVSNFIPVILSREVEKEFAPYRASMPSFIVYPRNATTSDPDITLETLNYEAFEKALGDMGIGHERVQTLSRETGRSLTVLRRRLSQLPAIRKPDWAEDKKIAAQIAPFLLAGAWKADNKADQAMLEALSDDIDFDELERRLNDLLPLESAPVWRVGAYRGVVSKIDALFAIKDVILEADLERFFTVASLVLEEPDPALELPEDKQWAAGIYGKSREISGALRDGIAESLVLLSVYGAELFKGRLNFNSEWRAEKLVREILEPLTLHTLESQSSDLPLYSEAAPEPFLSIIETDLKTEEPASLALMKPMSNAIFGRSHRTGLLWALENLAWSARLFMRTVLVLGRLAERAIDDNLVNKPSSSLSAIFCSWMPQTSADLEARKKALSKLAETFPSVAWPILIEQFEQGSRVGHFSHKPRWRPDGHGYGNVVTRKEGNEFAIHALHTALAWPNHMLSTISDLVQNLDGLDDSLRPKVWDVVDDWIKDANDADRAALREKIRVSTFTRRALRRRKLEPERGVDERARAAYEALEPIDPVLRHSWLFKQAWVDESADEIAADEPDYEKREERISQLRQSAIEEVLAYGGISEVFRLAESGQAQHTAGWYLSKAITDLASLKAALLEIADGRPVSGGKASFIGGALNEATSRKLGLLERLIADQPDEVMLSILLIAPFEQSTWDVVETLSDDLQSCYWQDIAPGWNRTDDDVRYAVRKLVEAGRPRAAFNFAQFDLKKLRAQDVFDLLKAIAGGSNETSKTYLLDPHHLRDAFKLLNASGQMDTDEMAGLEFQFVDIFDEDNEVGLVNLERRIEAHPELFVEAVKYSFIRDDDGEDASEPELTETQRSNRASSCYRMLDRLRQTPGHDDGGALVADRIVSWVEQVRAGCTAIARGDIGDQMIGKLLSHAPKAEDGIWPCLPVRDALEQVMNEHLSRGLTIAMRNSRGVHWRGEGGAQERSIAAKYAGWAQSMEYTHPRVAAILRGLEASYLREADWEDNEAKITRRMRY
ncbi:HigA family addiction module antitoxin [Erythrobacter sp. BLCC-B19]|uniref:HigA family addiction module antitoxin n=1 Tax=Erythrobacter sp. BLCC-B19 TaxID=3025315 RepID=UPI00235E44C8|nr:HigA family addiction module antitoxin [Erythrobacter sp. BLCC-B19]WDA41431.1 HigA family addiction module antitoxin [Erythrobacter sp. BLCC-B19]